MFVAGILYAFILQPPSLVFTSVTVNQLAGCQAHQKTNIYPMTEKKLHCEKCYIKKYEFTISKRLHFSEDLMVQEKCQVVINDGG